VACFEVLVARETCQESEDRMKRAMFLATTALLAMLLLAPMAWAQGGTMLDGTMFSNPCARLAYKVSHKLHLSPEETNMRSSGFCNQGPDNMIMSGSASVSSYPGPPGTGGADILLPAASLLLGSGILTYAILGRR
jgi:hypothetical protein